MDYKKLSKIADSKIKDEAESFYDILNDVKRKAEEFGVEGIVKSDGKAFTIRADRNDQNAMKLLSYVEENYLEPKKIAGSVWNPPMGDGSKVREGIFKSILDEPSKEATSTDSVREVKYTNGVVRSFINDLDRCSQIMYGDEWIDFPVDAPTMNEAISFLKANGGEFVEEKYIDKEVLDEVKWPAEKEMKDWYSFYEDFFATI